jgi:hypothetical protein
MRAICRTHLILLDLIILFGEQCKLLTMQLSPASYLSYEENITLKMYAVLRPLWRCRLYSVGGEERVLSGVERVKWGWEWVLFLGKFVVSDWSSVCSHLLTLVPRSRIFLPWRWRRYVPPKRPLNQDLHSATSQKTTFFIVTAVKTLNLTCIHLVHDDAPWRVLLNRRRNLRVVYKQRIPWSAGYQLL